MTGNVTVVGSANLDIVLSIDHRPLAGETVMGNAVLETPGGKGVNQALAAARVVPTSFVGNVGNDSAGHRLAAVLADAQVGTEHLGRSSLPTGRAYVSLTPDGENSIVVMSLANSQLEAHDALRALEATAPTVVLIQLEVPMPVTAAVVEWCSRRSVRLVFNPSPADATALAKAGHADPLIVNQHEAAQILLSESADVVKLAAELSNTCRSVVVTAGSRGAFVGVSGRVTHVQGASVGTVVDTTGAGDAFAGTLAAHLALGLELVDAAERANAEASRLVQLERVSR